jgi:hypothetical protein
MRGSEGVCFLGLVSDNAHIPTAGDYKPRVRPMCG